YLETGLEPISTPLSIRRKIIQEHLKKLHRFYGKVKGVWYARKHVAGYVRELPAAREFLQKFNSVDFGAEQQQLIQIYFEDLMIQGEGAIAA
ncbi:MAG: tRNA-dihydrouridine synthase, partial [Pseudomonadales bacterium]|nr:tRNA-dihydrouridine synthase [Pseudomonadales bacterium]